MEQRETRRGMTLVYTGEGKGKTTAALGLCVRAAGRGYRTLVLQFIKGPQRKYGEKTALARLGIDVRQLGIGFTWTKTPEEHRAALAAAFAEVKREVASGEWDVIVLDELNNALAITKFPIDDVLPLHEVLDLLQNRPSYTHLVIAGRSARPESSALADLVTEMQPVKHYYEEGIPAVFGIEY